MFGREQKIKLNHEETIMFEELWQIYQNEKSLGIENFPEPPEDMFNHYIEYLALKYRFDPNNFTIHNHKGKFLHSRVERAKESVN